MKRRHQPAESLGENWNEIKAAAEEIISGLANQRRRRRKLAAAKASMA